jgi:hypothetical protein
MFTKKKKILPLFVIKGQMVNKSPQTKIGKQHSPEHIKNNVKLLQVKIIKALHPNNLLEECCGEWFGH